MANDSAMLTMLEVQQSMQKFGVIDYLVFVGMLVGCSGIGLYYAYQGKSGKKDEASEYLMGGRNMSTFPVAMSLVASYISGITLLGTPTETYLNGTEYVFGIIGFATASCLASWFVLPVFHDLQLSSTYEYLRLRYNKRVQLLGSILFAMNMVCWLPIVCYVPALAFNQVTGINTFIVPPLVCLVCIFYTTVGGLKAVVWTDVVQAVLMIAGIFVVVVKGTYDLGGFQEVWKRNLESGRLQVPRFSFDPTIRHSMAGLSIGAACGFLQDAFINQVMIQRYLTLPSLPKVRIAIGIYIVGLSSIVLMCSYAGLLSYATYHDCDPLKTGLAKAKDQVLPLLVMRVLSDYPGTAGIFISGVFSAALSSLSTGLNSMAAVVLEDFVKPARSTKLSDRATMIVLRSVVVIFGMLCVSLVFVVAQMGSVLMLSWSLASITSGASLGIFIGGMLIPSFNAHGAFYGGMIGMLLSGFVIMGAQHAEVSGVQFYLNKKTSTSGCDYTDWIINNTTASVSSDYTVFPLFRISYQWYTLFGTLITLISGIIISYATGGTDYETMDLRVFARIVRKFVIKKAKIKREEKELLNLNK